MVTRSANTWEAEAEKSRKVRKESIQEQWLLPQGKLPSPDRMNVLSVPKESGLLTQKELDISESDATQLVKKMGAGDWSAEEVTVAFLKRATIGHQLLNNATEFMVEDAIARARELDTYFAQHKKLIGPLHGVPVSTKEHIWHKGRVASGAYAAQVDKIAPEDSHLVRLAKNSGAVFHLRTNEPLTLMTGDCHNNIWGQTLNPWHLKLSCGGSSGGEGASIGFKSAAIGLGTDIGGSIRIPAAFNGIYGFRPSASRMPYDGIELPGAGQESVKCVIGPLARSIDDISLMMQTILDQEPWDTEVALLPLPWKSVESSKDITVGIMWSDGIVHPHPPMTRALKKAKAKLQAGGIKVIDWEPFKSMEILQLIVTLFFPDGGKAITGLVAASGEPMNNEATSFLQHARELTVTENWACNAQRDQLRAEFHALMKERGVDVILCPPYVGGAPERNKMDYGTYTMLWNLLDQPALVFPTGAVVDPELDPVEIDYKPTNPIDQQQYDKYDPKVFEGAPIGLQVVGKHLRDEETVAAARLIEQMLQN
ncbi:fatty-acid amide hydrolase [Leptodontidium sp. 2 PMI_412]|nr:fatty-acid amide hydrolase [Leptodontidium sp. 2 PMI_412]